MTGKIDCMTSSETIVEALRQRGERITIQRRWVIEALCAMGGHQTIQAIREHLDGQSAGLNEPTIYRILQWLKGLELVSQTDLGQNGIVYECLEAPRHHHLVCLGCGQMIDLEDEVMMRLRATLRDEYDFEPRIDHMAIFGYCRDCRS